MNPQQIVTENAKRRVVIARDVAATANITSIYQTKKLLILFNVFDLNNTKIATAFGNGLTCHVPAEQFTFDFDQYDAKNEEGLLAWFLNQIQKSVDQRLAQHECILTAQLPEYPDRYLEHFQPQFESVQDPTLEFRLHTKFENQLVH